MTKKKAVSRSTRTYPVAVLVCIAILGVMAGKEALAYPPTSIVFGTDWFAQAQHGGYYEGVANGIYKKYGLHVRVAMGGPGINGQQLLLAGRYQFYMGTGFGGMVAAAHGLPLVTVATIFQASPTEIIAHKWCHSPADLVKAAKILVSSNEEQTWWPWAMRRWKFQKRQQGVYTGSVAPFLADKSVAQQAYAGSEGYYISKGGGHYNAFVLANYGYPDYSETIETTKKMITEHPGTVRRFIKATMLAWKAYMNNPALGNAAIRKSNPKETPAVLHYALRAMLRLHELTAGAAGTYGIGTMTNARWKRIFAVAVRNGLVPATFDYHKCYTLRFIRNLRVFIGPKKR